jgi:formate dehydrogenase
MSEQRVTFCRICEQLCGMVATVENGRVTALRPDAAHVATRGFGCPKGLHQHEIYQSPDRVRAPLRRVGRPGSGRFQEVSWEAALGDIGARLRRLRRRYGRDCAGLYVGTAAGFSLTHMLFAQGFVQGLGSRQVYTSASQDCNNKFVAAREMYGFPMVHPFPDVDRTRCLIVVGANPAMSKLAFFHLPRPVQRIRDIERRGGRVFWVDPRRTESAHQTGEHLFIRPGTDVYLYLSFLHELVASGGVDAARADRYMTGREALEGIARDWPAERTAPVTGIDPGALRHLVTTYREADGAALYCSTGVNMGPHGTLCYWLQEGINALSGNLDRPGGGGTVVGRGIVDLPRYARRLGIMQSTARSRVGGFGAVADGLPGGILADEIRTPGPGQLRALVVTGGNPLLTMPGAGRLREALDELELLVCLDIQRTETAERAHYLLPTTGPLERPDLLFAFPLLFGQQSVPYLQATEPVTPAPDGVLPEMDIYLRLAAAARIPLFGSWALHGLLQAGHRTGWLDQRRVLSAVLRAGGQGSFDTLVGAPHGRLRPPLQPGSYLGQRVVTPDGKVQLAPAALREALRDLPSPAALDTPTRAGASAPADGAGAPAPADGAGASAPADGAGAPAPADGNGAPRPRIELGAEADHAAVFQLISKREVRTHNSWTHNTPALLPPDGESNHLYLHPADAAGLGLGEGDLADVSSAVATVRLPVRLDADLGRQVAAIPHGWGHQGAPGQRVAHGAGGVNVNLLTPDGPDALERPSGMARLTALPVRVAPAAGPRDPQSWSGVGSRVGR